MERQPEHIRIGGAGFEPANLAGQAVELQRHLASGAKEVAQHEVAAPDKRDRLARPRGRQQAQEQVERAGRLFVEAEAQHGLARFVDEQRRRRDRAEKAGLLQPPPDLVGIIPDQRTSGPEPNEPRQVTRPRPDCLPSPCRVAFYFDPPEPKRAPLLHPQPQPKRRRIGGAERDVLDVDLRQRKAGPLVPGQQMIQVGFKAERTERTSSAGVHPSPQRQRVQRLSAHDLHHSDLHFGAGRQVEAGRRGALRRVYCGRIQPGVVVALALHRSQDVPGGGVHAVGEVGFFERPGSRTSVQQQRPPGRTSGFDKRVGRERL